jgi:hypothetical protein
MKVRRVDLKDIEPLVAEAAWVRRQGLSNALPPTVNVPPEKPYHVTVSGSLEQSRPESKHGQTGDIVAAWDVFRHDPDDVPFIFNAEHYFVLRVDGKGWLFGPYKQAVEPAHWLKEIPPAFENCEVLMSTTKD